MNLQRQIVVGGSSHRSGRHGNLVGSGRGPERKWSWETCLSSATSPPNPAQLSEVPPQRLLPLPAPYDDTETLTPRKALDQKVLDRIDTSLDGFSALGLSRPQTPEAEQQFVERFLSGLEKLLSADNNWPFLEQLTLSLDHCARCQTCVEACPIYTASGHDEVYRPTFRSEVFRRLVNEYAKPGGKALAWLKGEHIELNAATLGRLLESAYRCTLCRRCAQACPMGVDNALLTREIRKLFSMEMGIAPKEIHEKGSMLQLRTGSSTGMNAHAVRDNVAFLDEEIHDQTGLTIDDAVGQRRRRCAAHP